MLGIHKKKTHTHNKSHSEKCVLSNINLFNGFNLNNNWLLLFTAMKQLQCSFLKYTKNKTQVQLTLSGQDVFFCFFFVRYPFQYSHRLHIEIFSKSPLLVIQVIQ